ncbi:MAG: hypothetical protein IPL61_38450 [Myxococcales bacterium]|nr:hypothetical protein [Myxococcales bacterium]
MRDWELPTAWLLGTQLTASLRDMIASGLTEADVRDWMEPGPPIKIAPVDGADCVWLDFLADTGDSPLLVYRLAHLLQRPTLDVYTPADDRADAAPPGERPARRPSVTLPRGQVLVIGGDTAYRCPTPTRCGAGCGRRSPGRARICGRRASR